VAPIKKIDNQIQNLLDIEDARNLYNLKNLAKKADAKNEKIN